MSTLKTAEMPGKPAAKKNPPTPPGHFFWGHIPHYTNDQIGYERHIAATYGDIVHMRFVNRHAYLLNNPEDVKQVMVDQADKFYKAPFYREVLSRFLGNGLLTSDGDFWRRQRKLSQPAFHHKRIQAYGQIMVDHTLKLLEQWQPG